MRQSTQQQQADFTLARHIATWLPHRDEQIALQMIERAEQRQADADRFEPVVGIDREDWSAR